MVPYQPAVKKLIQLLGAKPLLKQALLKAIKNAEMKGVKTLKQFLNHLDGMLTHLPTEEQLGADTEMFWCVVNKSPSDTLKKNALFNSWVKRFMMSMGTYMDTTESADRLDSFIQNKKYKIEEYALPASGWLTYNQFLARHTKPGARPVKQPCDQTVIVSPADCKFLGAHKIEANSVVTVKGDTCKISDLLADSSYYSRFKHGVFTHGYLSVYAYHRFHTPVAGKVVEVKNIPGRTWTNEIKESFFKKTVDDIGFQFNQTRGYIIIKTDHIGYVAVIPVGMGFVSSVNLTVEKGAVLAKGEEFGFFANGGSDIIMLFEKDAVKFSAFTGMHYKQGEKIAKARAAKR